MPSSRMDYEVQGMKIVDSRGQTISTLVQWRSRIFDGTSKEKDWKKGRSAHSLAEFMVDRNGSAMTSDARGGVTDGADPFVNTCCAASAEGPFLQCRRHGQRPTPQTTRNTRNREALLRGSSASLQLGTKPLNFSLSSQPTFFRLTPRFQVFNC